MAKNHINSSFDRALNSIVEDVLMMASLTERSLSNAMRGLFERSTELCLRVIADDEEIDQLEKQVDRNGIEIMLRFQPVASDLRQVISAMKVSGNLERIGDQAAKIAKRARKLNGVPEVREVHLLEPMYWEALALFKDSLRAYVDAEVELAMSLKVRDKKVDIFNVEIGQSLTDAMAKNPERITDYLELLFIARHIERVGDQAKNIGEDAVYAAAAEDVRHVKIPAAG
jgi:phosphate transport system protein